MNAHKLNDPSQPNCQQSSQRHVPTSGLPQRSTNSLPPAIKLYGPAADKKARWAFRAGWLYTKDGSVFRKNSNGRDMRLTQFEMNGRPHVSTYIFEYQVIEPVARMIELEKELAYGQQATSDRDAPVNATRTDMVPPEVVARLKRYLKTHFPWITHTP